MNRTFTASQYGDFPCLMFSQAPPIRATAAMVWLHGIGERGNHLPLVAKYGLPAALIENRLSVNADVICPQLEADREWEPRRIQALLFSLRASYQHLALVGFSLGGMGVCELLGELGPHADVHVAIAPRVRHAATAPQEGTRLLLLAGEHDQCDTTPPFLHDLAALGALVEHAILPGEGHFISESALKHPKFELTMSSIGVCFDWH